jgi:NADH-ubiquinone oxidoreductase chain 5
LNFKIFNSLFFRFKILFLYDIKKIIALSTIRHIRIIILLLYLSFDKIIFLYIFIHALFKSKLFLCIGLIIFYNFDIQNFLKLNFLNKNLILNFFYFLFFFIIWIFFFFFLKDFLIDLILFYRINFFFFFFFYFNLYI